MGFNGMTLVMSALLAENVGASPQQALPIAILASTARNRTMGMVMAIALGRTEGRPNSSGFTVTGPSATTTAARAGAGGILGGGNSTVESLGPAAVTSLDIGMPSFINMTRPHAERLAAALGLEITFENDTGGDADFVVKQTPTVGGHPRKNGTVTLELGQTKV
jgi:hypothetical protein